MSALLAMTHGSMTLAFLGALVANPSAELAVGLGAFARAAHGGSSGLANLGAVDVQCDATREHLHVLLLKALRCAVIACLGTGVASLNAGGKALMGHMGLPEGLHNRQVPVPAAMRLRQTQKDVCGCPFSTRNGLVAASNPLVKT